MEIKRMGKGASPRSGVTQTWKLWRHCCCRFGWLPLLVAPLVTASSLLDLYATFDCEFIHINVGFIPSNDAWSQSTASIGLFHYYSLDQSNLMDDFGINGCARFSDDFEAQFVEGDRTWEVTRIMAYISGISGVVAALTAWLFVFTPLPVGFFWPGVLLPTLLIAFISEGSKFLFLDTAACRSALWYPPSGTDSPPQVAQSCHLGKTSYYAMAATAAFFVSLVMVCILSPKKRELDENFGEESLYMDGNGGELDTSLEDDHLNEIDLNLSNINHEDSFLVMQTRSGTDDYASSFDEGGSFEYAYPDTTENDSFFAMINNNGENNIEQRANFNGLEKPTVASLDIASHQDEDDGPDEICTSPASGNDALSPRHDKQARPSVGTRVVSEARLAMAEDMQSQTDTVSDDLIDKCVLDLTRSFQTDELEVFEPDDETDSQPGDDDEFFPHSPEATAASQPESVVFAEHPPTSPR